jgi:hypothetical protein
MIAFRSPLMLALAVALSSLTSVAARADDDQSLQRTRAEQLRLEYANSIQLRAFDLLDELVYQWTLDPPAALDTPVVLADVTVPLGFGSGLEALVENHLVDLLLKHKETHVKLVHCPGCQALTVHSDRTGTVVSRGIDQPGALKAAGATAAAQQALFLDFEAEGTSLVLRARFTTLDDTMRITSARTVSSKTSSAPLLRTGDHLVSAEQARKEYVDALNQKGPIAIPVRLQMVQFSAPSADTEATAGGIAPLPIVWLQSGVEFNVNHARDWSGSLIVGGTWVPQLYSGLMIEGRVNRLLTGAASSLTNPNLYGFVGAQLSMLNGPGALLLRDDVPNLADLLGAATGAVVETTFWPAFTTGLDLRVGNRLGLALFAQVAPTLANSPNIGTYLNFGIAQVHAIGGEVSLWF